jgi:hypothetical protein
VLYRDNPASRPYNPVNVYFGLFILREIFNQSDEEVLHSLMFDIRYQHALHTASFAEQLVSKNSLTNFRAAVYRYNQEHGINLIQQEIKSHAQQFSKILNIEGKTRAKNSNGDQFEIDEKEDLVKKYPSGHKSITSTFKKGSYRAHFNQKHCNHCPLRKDCPVIE